MTGRPERKTRKPDRAALGDIRIEPKLLVDEVASRIRGLIFGGRLRPGDRIVETDLAEMFGVSRPLLREAIRTLQAERLCVVTPHRGAHVPVLTWEDAIGIYHVRELLEGEACALCAAAITEEGIAGIEGALLRFSDAVKSEDAAGRIAATEQFYARILAGCGNPVIEEVLQGLIARISFLRARSMGCPGRSYHSYVEMKDICDAIRRGNPELARAAAIRHVRNAREAARAAFDVADSPR